MTRVYLILAIAINMIAGAASGLALLALDPNAGVSKANYNRLRQGQTREEAEAILGGPAGYHQTKNARTIFISICGSNCEKSEWWIGDDIAISIVFDSSGRVASVSYFEPPTEPGPWRWFSTLACE